MECNAPFSKEAITIDFLQEVYLTLRNGLDIPSSNIFKYMVDDGYHTQTNEPIIRIVQLPSYPHDFADDTRISTEVDIQIDIWQKDKEPRELGNTIKALMFLQNYTETYEEPLYDEEAGMFRSIRRYKGYFVEV